MNAHESLTEADKIACAESMVTAISEAMNKNRGRQSSMANIAWDERVMIPVLRWQHGDTNRCLCMIEEIDYSCVLDKGRPDDCIRAKQLVKENSNATRDDCKYWVSIQQYEERKDR